MIEPPLSSTSTVAYQGRGKPISDILLSPLCAKCGLHAPTILKDENPYQLISLMCLVHQFL